MPTDATGTPTSPDSIPTYNTSVDSPSGTGFNGAMAAIQTIITQLKAGTLSSGKIAIAALFGYPADGSKVLAGDGTWITVSSTPGGAAGGDLTGSTYPNPVIAALAVTAAKIANATITGGKIAAATIAASNLSFFPVIHSTAQQRVERGNVSPGTDWNTPPTVAFASAFASAPTVVVSGGPGAAHATSISTTGFTASMAAWFDVTGHTEPVYWVAIGV